jgi:hypothetical protein
MKKLTHEYVKGEFLKRSWVLRSKYVNSRTKLDFTCDKGHKHSIKWCNFKAGTGCKTCSEIDVTKGLDHITNRLKEIVHGSLH